MGNETSLKKINIAIIFGGQSSEHDISCISAINVIRNINKLKYNIFLVGITQEGRWLFCDSLEDVISGDWRNSDVRVIFSPDRVTHGLYMVKEDMIQEIYIDVVFPVLHGICGEDGTIQGLCELANINYVGCGVLASALGMDKVYTKRIVSELNIKQAEYVLVRQNELENISLLVSKIESKNEYPMFIKPSRSGSSQGVYKVYNQKELIDAIINSLKFDSKILVEEYIKGREIECAVLQTKEGIRMKIGEVVSNADFYSYDSKYKDGSTIIRYPGDLSDIVIGKIYYMASQIFEVLECTGLSRIDFFLTSNEDIYFNEINTMPGFTNASMFPVLWGKEGLGMSELIDELIYSALKHNVFCS